MYICCISLCIFYTIYRYRYLVVQSMVSVWYLMVSVWYLMVQSMVSVWYIMVQSMVSVGYAVFNLLLNINLFYTIKMRKEDGFYKKIDLLFQNYDDSYFYLEEHCVVENGKEQNVVFISDTKNNVKDDIENFKKNFETIFEKRNLIVYCGVRGPNLDGHVSVIEDDITSDFRSFMYYFDKNDFKLDIFFSYLNINLDSEFVLYKNDNNFTEKNFIVRDILDKTFIQLL